MTKFLAIFSLVIIVLRAFAGCGEESTPTPAPAAQAIEAEVQRSVAAALADQSADSIREDAMSTEDMSALVQEAIGAQAPEGISPEQVQSAIERAVSEALDQATMASEEPAMMMGAQGSSDPRFHPCPARNRSPARYRNTHPSPNCHTCLSGAQHPSPYPRLESSGRWPASPYCHCRTCLKVYRHPDPSTFACRSRHTFCHNLSGLP